MYKFNKYFLFFLLKFILCSNLFAQREIEFLGALKIKDTTMISYRLNLKLRGNTVLGYSVTSIGGPHETKSYIKGEYFPDDNLLEFQEYGIEYTKSDIESYDFCFVHFSGTVKNINKQNVIQGKFEGRYDDGTSCIDGELMVHSITKIIKKAKKTDKRIQQLKKVSDSIKDKINLVGTIEEKRINIIRADETTSIFFNTSVIDLNIWDAGKIDGDKISVSLNGNTILDQYQIGREAKILPIKLDKAINTIEIKAENNGKIAPNTAKIELLESDRKIELLTNLDKNRATRLLLHNTSIAPN